MKKTILSYMLAAVCSVCVFTACSDDDDPKPDPTPDPVEKNLTTDDIAGNYEGALNIAGQDVPGQTITLAKVDATTVKVQLKNFAFGEIPIGDIEADCKATTDNTEKSELSGTTTVKVAAMGNIELPVSVSGSATKGGELTLKIGVKEVPLLGEISVDFKGSKK